MHRQTNIFAPQPHEKEPLYGVFGGLESFPSSSNTINSLHTYTVDWNSERIIWSVDGHHVRTIQKCKFSNMMTAYSVTFYEASTNKPRQRRTACCIILHIPCEYRSEYGMPALQKAHQNGVRVRLIGQKHPAECQRCSKVFA